MAWSIFQACFYFSLFQQARGTGRGGARDEEERRCLGAGDSKGARGRKALLFALSLVPLVGGFLLLFPVLFLFVVFFLLTQRPEARSSPCASPTFLRGKERGARPASSLRSAARQSPRTLERGSCGLRRLAPAHTLSHVLASPRRPRSRRHLATSSHRRHLSSFSLVSASSKASAP
jgi:hypothetical protein